MDYTEPLDVLERESPGEYESDPARQVLDSLPVWYRVALEGLYIDGRSQASVARQLGIQRTTLQGVAERAKAEFKRRLAITADGEYPYWADMADLIVKYGKYGFIRQTRPYIEVRAKGPLVRAMWRGVDDVHRALSLTVFHPEHDGEVPDRALLIKQYCECRAVRRKTDEYADRLKARLLYE